MVIPENKFRFLAEQVKQRTGLVLGPEKGYLIESRLTPLAKAKGFKSVEAFVDAMMAGDGVAAAAAGEALATHETFFFRDKTPFDQFQQTLMPRLRRQRGGAPIRIWCAAASTGQEPYSLAMIIEETGLGPVEILATDLCASVMDRAREGIYNQFEVQRGLPIQRLVKHFDQMGDKWRVKDRLRDMVRFQPGNLLDEFVGYGRFDVIFCRNLLIYFDLETKAKVLSRLARQLHDEGYLVLGAAETVLGVTDALKPVPDARGLYAKPEAVAKMEAA